MTPERLPSVLRIEPAQAGRFCWHGVSFTLALVATCAPLTAIAAPPQIVNASAETADAADPTSPAGWFADAWGNLSYGHAWLLSGAFEGSRALRVALTTVSGEGDARWMSASFPVAAQAGQSYSLHHHYRSDVSTAVLAQAQSADGKQSQWILVGNVPAAATWTAHAANVSIPSWAATLRLCHVLGQPGFLETDAWSWQDKLPDPPPPAPAADPPLAAVSPSGGNVLPNPSFEATSTYSATMPKYWTFVVWGAASVSTGVWKEGPAHEGTFALRMSQPFIPADGDAKWWSDPIPLVNFGGKLRLTCYYQGTAGVSLLLRAEDKGGKDGQAQWYSVASGPAWAAWRVLSGLVELPAFTHQVRVGMRIDDAGDVAVDNCSFAAEVLTPTVPVVLGSDNVLGNASFEGADPWDPGRPAGWDAVVYGTAQGKTTWLNGGFDGERSVRVEVFVKTEGEGDGRWQSAPIALVPKSATPWRVSISDRYRTNAPTRLRARVRSADGKQAQWLIGPELATSPSAWAQAQLVADLPDWAATLEVMHALEVAGQLDVDAVVVVAGPPDPPPAPEDPALAPASLKGTNVLPNPSFEAASVGDPKRPAYWRMEAWDAALGFTTATWLDGGALHGLRALRLAQTALPESGDAKWWSDPVPVTDLATDLRVTCSYQGSAGASLLLLASNGKVQAEAQAKWYAVAAGPAWPSWRLLSGTITGSAQLPAWTTHVRVGVRIEGTGEIDVDACSLGVMEPATSPPPQEIGDTNLVANPSLELADPWDPGRPASWVGFTVGQAIGSVSWLQVGADGERSGRVSIASIDPQLGPEGDARWRSAPVALKAPGRVAFRTQYRSNVESRLRIRASSADGKKVAWLTAKPAQPSPGLWAEAELVADLPAFTATIEVEQSIEAVGYLDIDDVRVVRGPPGPIEPEPETSAPSEPEPAPAILGDINAVPNPSLEQASTLQPSLPWWWGGVATGALGGTWSWVQPGIDGDRCVKLIAKRKDQQPGSASIATRGFRLAKTGPWAKVRAMARSTMPVELWLVVHSDVFGAEWRKVAEGGGPGTWAPLEGVVPVGELVRALQVVVLTRAEGTLEVDAVSLTAAATPTGQDARAQAGGNTPLAGFDSGPPGPKSTEDPPKPDEGGCSARAGAGFSPLGTRTLAILVLALGLLAMRRRVGQGSGTAQGPKGRGSSRRIVALAALCLGGAAACTDEPIHVDPWHTRATAQGFEISRDGKTFHKFWPIGVNFGLAIPGTDPGEMEATGAQIRRWLQVSAYAGANTIRIYTVQSPVFYRELRAYNLANPSQPLFLMQGIWIDEPPAAELDYFSVSSNIWVNDEIAKVVSVIHGDITIPAASADLPLNYGRAVGTFEDDVSPWLIGWLFGREMEPYTLESTLALHQDAPQSHKGELLSIDNDSPITAWIVSKMDAILRKERDQYGQQHPIGFSNWPTLDPLLHPTEPKLPVSVEDTFQVDLEPIETAAAYKAGVFMSYHAYPYYPDFILHEPAYQSFADSKGKFSFIGYLAALRKHHASHALIIAEVGHPSSLGNGHQTPTGQDHGDLDDQEQGPAVLRSLGAIHQAGLDGAYVFSIIDEWFKRAWVVERIEYPGDRRRFWHNVMNPEQNFGLVALRAGAPGKRIVLDGKDSEWGAPQAAAGPKQVAPAGDGADNQRRLRDVTLSSDAAYLHVRVRLQPPPGGVFDWQRLDVVVAFDTIDPERGDGRLDPAGKVTVGRRVEHLLRIDSPELVQLYVDKPYDLYGIWHGIRDPWQLYRTVKNDAGEFRPVRTITNAYDAIGPDGNVTTLGGVQVQETGRFRVGVEALSSHALVAIDPAAGVIEIRVPWNLLHFSDPSAAQIIDDDGSWGPRRATSKETKQVAVAAIVLGGKDEQESTLVDSVPAATASETGHALPATGWALLPLITWIGAPAYHEQTKPIVQAMRAGLGGVLPATIAWPSTGGGAP